MAGSECSRDEACCIFSGPAPEARLWDPQKTAGFPAALLPPLPASLVTPSDVMDTGEPQALQVAGPQEAEPVVGGGAGC